MIRLPKAVTVRALMKIAIEDIKKPTCSCYWHSIGEPDMCLEKRMPFPSAESYRDDYMDYLDFDPIEDGDDGPCTCHFCSTGKPEFCFEEDDGWNLIDLDLDCATDGAVPFDDIPEPQVRVNKHTRTSRRRQTQFEFDADLRSLLSRAYEMCKKHFMAPRRDRERISQILACEESDERALQLESEMRYFDAWFPQDEVRISSDERAELLQRNFPGLSVSSTHHIASSWRIQGSSSFKGLEALQKLEAHVARKNEEYFCELDGFYPDDDSMCSAHQLVDSFNHAALLAFQH